MAHTDRFTQAAAYRRGMHDSAAVFLTRERLDDEEMAEWVTAAFGDQPEFKAMDKQAAIEKFAAFIDKSSREIFGPQMSGRSIGGMALLMAQMMHNVETAQGYKFDSKTMPVELKNGILLSVALDHLARGKKLSSVGMDALHNGGAIMDALSDYAREVALVLPFKGRDSAQLRDKIRTTSSGMPAVDIKFSSIAREYQTHVIGAAPGSNYTAARSA